MGKLRLREYAALSALPQAAAVISRPISSVREDCQKGEPVYELQYCLGLLSISTWKRRSYWTQTDFVVQRASL